MPLHPLRVFASSGAPRLALLLSTLFVFIGWRLWVNEKQTMFNKEKTPWQYDTATQFQPHREKPIQPRTPRKTTPARRGPNSLAKSLDHTSELQTKRIALYVQ